MTKQDLLAAHKKEILQIATDLSELFLWSETKEGTIYWRRVCSALERIGGKK